MKKKPKRKKSARSSGDRIVVVIELDRPPMNDYRQRLISLLTRPKCVVPDGSFTCTALGV